MVEKRANDLPTGGRWDKSNEMFNIVMLGSLVVVGGSFAVSHYTTRGNYDVRFNASCRRGRPSPHRMLPTITYK